MKSHQHSHGRPVGMSHDQWPSMKVASDAKVDVFCGSSPPSSRSRLPANRNEVLDTLRATVDGFRAQFLARHVTGKADGQVFSIAWLFALIAAGGELATIYGVTGWKKGEAQSWHAVKRGSLRGARQKRSRTCRQSSA